MGRALYPALALVSVAAIAFQLALMQILSIAQWHHFASLTIAVALLGFGTSGTVLALTRQWLQTRFEKILPLACFACAIAMPLSVWLARSWFGGFDAYLLAIEPRQMLYLLLTQLLLLVPFFLAATVIGLVFVYHVQRISALYFANLLGSALGGILALVAMWLVLPQRMPAVCAIFPWLAGYLLRRGSGLETTMMLASAAVIALSLWQPPGLGISQYKGISYASQLPGAEQVTQRASPFGLLSVIEAPTLRPAADISLAFRGEVPHAAVAFNNGNTLGPVGDGALRAAALLDASPAALPYALGPRPRVLVLQAGTGLAAIHAAQRGAERVTAVESHRALVNLLAGQAAMPDHIQWQATAPRTMLARNQDRYDLVLLPRVGSFGGDTGMGALAQQQLLTVEAITLALAGLEQDGVLLASAWLDAPPRNSLRLLETLVQGLVAKGVSEPWRHIIGIRNWGSITFALKPQPFTAAERAATLAFCRQWQYDPGPWPGPAASTLPSYHQLDSPELLQQLTLIARGQSEALLESYPFRLSAPRDDRPWFSQFLRWDSWPQLEGLVHQRSLPLLELGYLVEWLSFAQLAGLSALLILLPLVSLGTRAQAHTVVYFGSLGLGYMLFEIALLHQLILYFGQPLFATAAALATLLLFSGIGSCSSGRWRLAPATAALAVAVALALAVPLLPLLLQTTLHWPAWGRVFAALLAVAGPAFLMGFPFPTGLGRLGDGNPQLAWAWGINGCLSVVAVPLATLVAVEAGFSRLLFCAVAAYCLAALAARRL